MRFKEKINRRDIKVLVSLAIPAERSDNRSNSDNLRTHLKHAQDAANSSEHRVTGSIVPNNCPGCYIVGVYRIGGI